MYEDYDRSSFLPKHFITSALIIICVGLFAVQLYLGGGQIDAQGLIDMGAKYNPLIDEGQYWRLITPEFLHLSVMHLVLNMMSLWVLGAWLEEYVGHWRLFLIFIFGGAMGNIISYTFNAATVTAGASTAIFALASAYLVIAVLNHHNLQLGAMGRQVGFIIVLNLVANLLMPNVDMWGHLGGLIGGIIVTFAAALTEVRLKYLYTLIFVLLYLTVAGVVLYLGGLPILHGLVG